MVKMHSEPTVRHEALDTTFIGVEHTLSTSAAPIHQFRGIKYATIPGRWRQSKLFTTYEPGTNATKYGPICPQTPYHSLPEGLSHATQPVSDEFNCLNLNITCPGNLLPTSRVPVMVWVHGGGKQGSGSAWIYDAGSIVQRSIAQEKPVIVITFNYRLGILGSAASIALQSDNTETGDAGVGNYGLRDQQRAFEWVRNFILEFGGDPTNITAFGESTGASDILCHLRSAENAAHPLFARAIVQSPLGSIEHDTLDIGAAGYHLAKLMRLVNASTVEELRAADVQKLVRFSTWQNFRATDDGVFFLKGWKDAANVVEGNLSTHRRRSTESGGAVGVVAGYFSRDAIHAAELYRHQSEGHRHGTATTPGSPPGPGSIHGLPIHQSLIIGDCSSSNLLYSLPASLWDAPSTVRRIKAVCQSMRAASTLMRVYDISTHTEEEDDLPERVIDLLGDARFAWPTDCAYETLRRCAAHGVKVYRYMFDEEAPPKAASAGVPRYAPDLAFLFDPAPHPDSPPPTRSETSGRPLKDYYPDLPPDEDEEEEDDFDDGGCWEYDAPGDLDADEWEFQKIRNAMQERWIAFAHGENPWREDRIYVFGPDGETGERSSSIVETRRRRRAWKEAFEPLGLKAVQKLGTELSSGPLMAMS
ncbi:alpha/beta-hydrolase [Punctularia strigosozonata HHB-11173 SS5]|uniref:alpha/beta-hydrolase n=1 Tax=Punctularia strigosozonata (strain HHB-11173) TaxID=741275 RepID=UPI0004417FF8|nr:alpha/beta-hydrolase [Punctularia strigosozonata HHB-11173 SS5]EIN08980.1 alpha/beta-hydrolase [Punctularia strigosozonata HHB-11173 SS5]